MVDQAVEQVRAHAHLLLLRARQEVFFGLALHRNRSGQRRRLHRRLGDRADIGVAGRCGIAATGTGFEGFHQIGRHRHRTVHAGAGQQLMQAVEAPLEQTHVVAIDVGAVGRHGFEQRFDRVTEIADGVDAGHARTALERVQIALQSVEDIAVSRHFAHAGDQAIAMVQQVATFFDEDVDQLAVELIEVQRAGIECRADIVAGHTGTRRIFDRGAERSGSGVFQLVGAAVGCVLICGVFGMLIGTGLVAGFRLFGVRCVSCAFELFCALGVIGVIDHVKRIECGLRVGLRRVVGGGSLRVVQLRRSVRLRIARLFHLIGRMRHFECLHRFDGVIGQDVGIGLRGVNTVGVCVLCFGMLCFGLLGSHMLGFGVLRFGMRGLDALVIGRVLGVARMFIEMRVRLQLLAGLDVLVRRHLLVDVLLRIGRRAIA